MCLDREWWQGFFASSPQPLLLENMGVGIEKLKRKTHATKHTSKHPFCKLHSMPCTLPPWTMVLWWVVGGISMILERSLYVLWNQWLSGSLLEFQTNTRPNSQSRSCPDHQWLLSNWPCHKQKLELFVPLHSEYWWADHEGTYTIHRKGDVGMFIIWQPREGDNQWTLHMWCLLWTFQILANGLELVITRSRNMLCSLQWVLLHEVYNIRCLVHGECSTAWLRKMLKDKKWETS